MVTRIGSPSLNVLSRIRVVAVADNPSGVELDVVISDGFKRNKVAIRRPRQGAMTLRTQIQLRLAGSIAVHDPKRLCLAKLRCPCKTNFLAGPIDRRR